MIYKGEKQTESLGERIKRLRLEKKMSLRKLASAVGVSDAGISLWERGKAEPALFNAICVADALGVSLNYLAGLSDVPIRVGDKIYAVYDGTDVIPDEARIEELTVTEVGTRYVFCSACLPAGNDIEFEIPIEDIGVKFFITQGQAQANLKEAKH